MPKVDVLVEVRQKQPEAFTLHSAASESVTQSVSDSESLFADLAGLGLDVTADLAPIPMFGEHEEDYNTLGLTAFTNTSTNPDMDASSVVVPCQVERSRLADLESRNGIRVWPNSPLTLFQECNYAETVFNEFDPDHLFDLANSAAGLDCRPFRPGVSIRTIRELLGVETVWSQGFRGQNIVVGIIDEGVNGGVYPVVGGFARPNAARTPGSAPITSHGSMCAADVLVADT